MHRFIRILVLGAFALIVAGILPYPAMAGPESSSAIEESFQKARQDYLDKNMNAAALQIQKGADYMKTEAAKASAKGKQALTASARELDQLADDVKKGAVISKKRMEDAFARAYLALASDAHIKSTESWAQKKRAEAGAALESANKHWEKSIAWAGQKVEKGASDAMTKSQTLALKLKKKGNLIADEVGKELQDAGNEIEIFGKKISSR